MTAAGDGRLGAALRLVERFLAAGSSGGILLLMSATVAVAWANSPWAPTYFALWDAHISLGVGSWAIEKTLGHWINDGLMAVFFFVIGLEIKRELLVGELAKPRQAALPIAGAIGGMLVPALIYAALNFHNARTSAGWGVPMATDIAFVVGAMALLAARAPIGLKVFLVALAIVDDMGAVLVIALFYSTGLSATALGAAGAIVVVLAAANLLGVRKPLVYAVLGVALWFAVLKSGVHATIGGVVLAMLVPARPRIGGREFVRASRSHLDEFEQADRGGGSIMSDERRQSAVAGLEDACEGVQTPLLRMEHALARWSMFVVMPVFALANAGVEVGGGFKHPGTGPLALGVILGLVLGKPVGIALSAWIAVRAGVAAMPRGVTWRHIIGGGCLGGIGFTMSLFIAHLAFGEGPEAVMAKKAILVGSLAAAIGGFAILSLGNAASTARKAAPAKGRRSPAVQGGDITQMSGRLR